MWNLGRQIRRFLQLFVQGEPREIIRSETRNSPVLVSENKAKIVRLSDEANDNRFNSPLGSLRHAIEDIEDGVFDPNRLIVIALNNRDDGYNHKTYMANISRSQSIALLESVKFDLLGD